MGVPGKKGKGGGKGKGAKGKDAKRQNTSNHQVRLGSLEAPTLRACVPARALLWQAYVSGPSSLWRT